MKYGSRQEPAPFGVQKLHAVAPWILLGFSGSVELGLRAVNDVRAQYGQLPPGAFWYPGRVAWHFARRLRWAWPQLDKALTDGGLELLLLGAVPAQSVGSSGCPGYMLRSPSFRLEVLPQGAPCSIGSGSNLQNYIDALHGVVDPDSPEFWSLINASLPDLRTAPPLIAFLINRTLSGARNPGISEHMHVGWVSYRQLDIFPNEWSTNDGSGDWRLDPFPDVVDNLADYRRHARAAGVPTGAARA